MTCQRSANLVHGLAAREAGLTALRHPFAEVPDRLHITVTSVLDEHGTLKGAVLLGWTHSGNNLVSYTSSPVPAADGKDGHHLQLWSFHPFQRAVRQCNIPLFRNESGPEAIRPTAIGSGSLQVTVCAMPEDSMLVVHGQSLDGEYGSEDCPGPCCDVTIIPLLGGCLPMQVMHFTYIPPHSDGKFQPLLQLIPPSTLVLSSSAGINCVQLFPLRTCGARNVTGLGDVPAVVPATSGGVHVMHSLVAFGSHRRRSPQEMAVCRARCHDTFVLEPFLLGWLPSNLPGHRLVDYSFEIVTSQPPPANQPKLQQSAAQAAAVSEYDFVASEEDEDDWDDHNSGRSSELGTVIALVAVTVQKMSAAGIPGSLAAARVACLLIEVDLATGAPQVLSAADATPNQHHSQGSRHLQHPQDMHHPPPLPPPPPLQQQQQQRLQTAMRRSKPPDVRAIAAAHASGWRRRLATPLDERRMPAIMTNASVLATGTSVERLVHPWLPICLTGYGHAAPG